MIYMVLEDWLGVTMPCSSLTSLWKEIPVGKKVNIILVNLFLLSMNAA